MNDCTSDLKEYLNAVLGYDVNIVPANERDINRLPLIIVNKYNVLIGTLFNRKIAFITTRKNVHAKIDELRKHIDIVKRTFNFPVVFVIESMKGYNRKRFIQRGISFIVPKKQMFLPELLIDFQDFAIGPRELPEKMTPATQYLLLYHLQIGSLEGQNFKEIAQRLNMGTMTITRAAYYLAEKGICEVIGTKDKHLHFGKEKYDLWKGVESLMQNPVKKQLHTSTRIEIENGIHSGINALSHYTDIADENKPYYALSIRNFEAFVKNNETIDFDEVEGDMVIEMWKYNPAILSKKGFIDPLSLYLIFREDTDERIQIVLNQLIDEVKW